MKPDSISKNKPFLKPSGRWTIIATVVTALALSGAALQYVLRFQRSESASLSNPVAIAPTNKAVSALGHLRPEGEVVYLSAPTALNGLGASRVAKLLVKEGDKVTTGQAIAILDSLENLQTSVKLALEDVKVAQANLAKVKAGAKTGELEAQKATIEGLEAELAGQQAAQDQAIARLLAQFNNARIEYQRYDKLFQSGAVTASQLDSKQLLMKTTQEQLNEAKVNQNRIQATFQQQIKAAQATLNQMAEIRPTDVQAAQAEIDRALANVKKAKADSELAYIRAPIDGKILKINTRPGETAGNKGIVALGQTDQMNVIAEVYELDVSKVKVGQKATITSHAFPGNLSGTVTQIGLQVNPQDVLSTDPTADVNRRIVEVKISLNPVDSQRVSVLTNLQVNVVIDM
ncbi:ABC exporter membrane fusion protein [Funiculus sociatus GB2-A5]|uniref:ABC exporter membrane fusion protein n=1 Tax=Funiculus sociatus GB2-A5 TaxID=2933946 RepID=A0ABV0JNJ9_9CYAN|nr:MULTISPECIES: ABC exporter membrane fusion protein [unclassified Trichocoleus]MBD1908577.1 ABC exporter membrane fusion protein [Trichocoleus sp. FACHB-832]MBD2063909.1 ABC exporter membrane fusion protein [Trichocoleus sp. FACHB-6]